ncbi:unnamed protein product [Cylicocyclus nassatus]|uniref:Uncharacterized protein n=1 Tax=Cylicocyclus nassatus TaxID=53992 RepID=A0AA36HAS6_CYLNA|nr:unnamed protein product [Cylicocyclus nassatus]
MLTSVLAALAAFSSAAIAAPLDSTFIELPDEMNNGTLYSISDFSPKVFVKTDEFELNFKSCVQFTYKLLKPKVRLRAYTCLLSEGGFCTLDKFAYPKNREGCAYLRPWLYPFDRYSFYFVLERRQRKYGILRKRIQRVSRKTGRLSTATSGELQLFGVVPCDQVCGKTKSDNRTG